jgi:RimJ/RimL family protein N-acetyltransferase
LTIQDRTMTQPLLPDLHEQFETERLIVRCVRPGDGAVICEGLRDSLAELRQFPASLPWALEIFCREGYANFIARREFRFLILQRDGQTLAGCCALNNPDWTVPAIDIGWWGGTPFLGHGYISEAVTGLVQFAFRELGVYRVAAFVDDLNHKSSRVCERAGMTLEGVLRHERVDPDGTLRNTRVYAATRERAPDFSAAACPMQHP